MNVKDIMTTNIVKISPDANVRDAIKKMHYKMVTSLFVEGENYSDYGIITRKDIINKVIAQNKKIDKIRVSLIMTTPLITVSQDNSIESVANLMAKTNIRRFPVIHGDKIIGLISNSDILKASVSRWEQI